MHDVRQIYDQLGSRVFVFAYRLTGARAAAEDVTQETFAALLRGTARYDSERGELLSFLFGVARNIALKRQRTESRWLLADDGESPCLEAVQPAGQETRVMVAQAVGALPPLQREALVLAEYEGCTLKEIAVIVEAEVGTVKARLHRARENLRRALSPLETLEESRR